MFLNVNDENSESCLLKVLIFRFGGYKREAGTSKSHIWKRCVEARISVGSGGGARGSGATSFFGFLSSILAPAWVSFLPAKCQVLGFMLSGIYLRDPETFLHRISAGHFSKKF